jgi:RimJ/RimL family protein N-acetyltransferase
MGITAFQILGVSTHPAHRNRGHARAVCAALIRAMWAAGARQCILFTETHNATALACYKKLGFETKTEYWMAKVKKITRRFQRFAQYPILGRLTNDRRFINSASRLSLCWPQCAAVEILNPLFL